KEWFDRGDIVVAEVICEGRPTESGGMECKQTEPPPPTPTPLPTSTSTPVPSPTATQTSTLTP
ncbi:MAG TPA: hypothetical protein VFY83_01555, partial [Anaerolineales bacterium]|nr:hypothetical protein [Anaerolineales bacterium]